MTYMNSLTAALAFSMLSMYDHSCFDWDLGLGFRIWVMDTGWKHNARVEQCNDMRRNDVLEEMIWKGLKRRKKWEREKKRERERAGRGAIKAKRG